MSNVPQLLQLVSNFVISISLNHIYLYDFLFFFLSVAELATYDQTKDYVLDKKILDDNIWAHLVCSLAAGNYNGSREEERMQSNTVIR